MRKIYQPIYKKFKKKNCEFCGVKQHYWRDRKTGDRKGNILHVHHIDRNIKNNDKKNLKTLCIKCHILEHKKHAI